VSVVLRETCGCGGTLTAQSLGPVAVQQIKAFRTAHAGCACHEICPVCAGRGFVPAGFYGFAMSTAEEACKRCHGLGTIVVARAAALADQGSTEVASSTPGDNERVEELGPGQENPSDG
jgi:DnaJ-class molecular chaperone